MALSKIVIIFLVITQVCCQVVEFDMFINNGEDSQTLQVDIATEHVLEKVTMFVNQHDIASGAGCIGNKTCVINKLVHYVEHRAVDMLLPQSQEDKTLNVAPWSTKISNEESLFSGGGWHRVGNPHSAKTPLLEMEARSKRRLKDYKAYISLFDRNASIAMKHIRAQVEKQASLNPLSNEVQPEYICLEIEKDNLGFNSDKSSASNIDDNDSKKTMPTTSEGVVLAIGIISAPHHLAHRMAIRQTWLSEPHRLSQGSVVHKFFIGISYHENSKYRKDNHKLNLDEVELEEGLSNMVTKGVDKDDLYRPIVSEALAYKDIGILHLEDHYLSTPKKVIALFLWGVEECGAYYVLRSNDDVYIRIDHTLSLLLQHPPANVMLGLLINGKTMHVPRPETYHKTQEELYMEYKVWTFTRSDYPSDKFPDFYQGNSLLLSRDFGQEISSKARQPWFRLMADDVMLSLILAKYYQQANKLQVKVDYEFEGLYTGCSNDAVWHFNIHPEHMYDLFHNQLLGRYPCEGGIMRFCCG